MKLVIGGYAQGKLGYVLQQLPENGYVVFDGILPDENTMISNDKILIINHFHDWIRQQILQGEDPEEGFRQFIEKGRECVIISNEIGNGIVPVDRTEREYREKTGKILNQLAKQSDEVVRVICGIGQRIK
ncbi:MAG: bifunctional adenosylcobinamide kinase/adenosylcobinamide-phosphate guanylyltransferase [Lachnospiraceae bacterium]